jgi:hypothetical protein
MSTSIPLRKVHERLRKALDEAAAIRSDRSPQVAAKWVQKIQLLGQLLSKANAIVATGLCSAQETREHLRLVGQSLAVIQKNAERSMDSLESGAWAIGRAIEECRRRWGAQEGPSR